MLKLTNKNEDTKETSEKPIEFTNTLINKSIFTSIIEKYKNIGMDCYHKHIAIIYDGDNVLSWGYNQSAYGSDLPIHAEFDAIRNLPPWVKKNRIVPAKIMVVRINNHNKFLNSKPCSICAKTIINQPVKHGYIIKKVSYSLDDGSFEEKSLQEMIDEISSTDDKELYKSKYYRRQRK